MYVPLFLQISMVEHSALLTFVPCECATYLRTHDTTEKANKQRCPKDAGSFGVLSGPLLGSWTAVFSIHPLLPEGWGCCLRLLWRGMNSILEGSIQMSQAPPKPPHNPCPANTTILGIRFQHMSLGRHKYLIWRNFLPYLIEWKPYNELKCSLCPQDNC